MFGHPHQRKLRCRPQQWTVPRMLQMQTLWRDQTRSGVSSRQKTRRPNVPQSA